MNITIEKLESMGACSEGIEWVKGQKSLDLVGLIETAIANPSYKAEDGEEYDTLDFCNWGIAHLMTKKLAVLYACFAARQVLKIYEDKYPGDLRPRQAIEAAERYAEDPSEENRQAAAGAAAEAPWAAGAEAAARAAAWAAAGRWAAEALMAARAAARAAADKNRMTAQILRYGVKLLMGAKQ